LKVNKWGFLSAINAIVLITRAIGDFWCRKDGDRLCSECSTGKWHGIFEKTKATEEFIKSTEAAGRYYTYLGRFESLRKDLKII
jgi:hypothetical protein